GFKRHQAFGPAATTSAPTPGSNVLKVSTNIFGSLAARASYAAPSAQVARGCRTSDGTSGQLAGMARLKIGSFAYATWSSAPDKAARIIDLVNAIFIRLPSP